MASLGPDASAHASRWLHAHHGLGPPPASSDQAQGDDAQGGGGGDGSEGADAVLVFLPGLKEITTLQEYLLGDPRLASEPQRSWVPPLHSSVPPEEQRRVFDRPPPGVRKIVLSTNIAETAITVDDVGFVVDTGRMKVCFRAKRVIRRGAHEEGGGQNAATGSPYLPPMSLPV